METSHKFWPLPVKLDYLRKGRRNLHLVLQCGSYTNIAKDRLEQWQ